MYVCINRGCHKLVGKNFEFLILNPWMVKTGRTKFQNFRKKGKKKYQGKKIEEWKKRAKIPKLKKNVQKFPKLQNSSKIQKFPEIVRKKSKNTKKNSRKNVKKLKRENILKVSRIMPKKKNEINFEKCKKKREKNSGYFFY